MIRLQRIVCLFAFVVMALAKQGLSADDESAVVERPTSRATASDENVSDNDPPTEDEGVQFAADFSNATDGRVTMVNGGQREEQGDVHGMYSSFAVLPFGAPGTLKMVITEDADAVGPDEQPGVLRMEYVDVSPIVQASGFVFAGTAKTDRITLPGWTLGEVTPADLQQTYLEFKFRAENRANPTRFWGTYSIRLEPEHQDRFGRRADFGVLIASQRWRTFRRPISSANNLDWFLTTVNEDQPASFHLVWGQNGDIQNYAPGDCLLIDDVRIVIE